MTGVPGTVPEGVRKALNLTDHQAGQLEEYAALLCQWQQKINLIGPATVPYIWERHILDCGQLAAHVPAGTESAGDMGAGAGLPGIVLSILGVRGMRLIESDQRKSAFMTTAIGRLGLDARVETSRLEDMPPDQFDLLTARALAPLDRLLPVAENLLKKSGKLLVLKGKSFEDELTVAGKRWTIQASIFPSMTDASGRVILIEGIRPADDTAD